MGTANWSLSKYGRNRGSAAATLKGGHVNSGVHTTSTTVSSLTDGAAGAGSAVTASVGTVLTIQVDEPARMNFGGVDATATSGHILFANETAEFEVPAGGTIRIIDVA